MFIVADRMAKSEYGVEAWNASLGYGLWQSRFQYLARSRVRGRSLGGRAMDPCDRQHAANRSLCKTGFGQPRKRDPIALRFAFIAVSSGVLRRHRCGWTPDLSCITSAEWFQREWARTGIVEVQFAEYMPDAWRVWLDWHKQVAPDNLVEIEAIKSDAGRNMTYSRVIATRNPSAELSP